MSPPTVNGGLPFAVEDYVWLDGAPVAIIRGALTLGSGGAWVRGVETPTTSCSKLSDGGFCGTYFLVTDAQARPVLMVRQSTGEVTQAATYDAYGHANRVPMVAGANDNQAATLGTVSLPSGNKQVRLRANYIKAPTLPVMLGGVTVFPASSVPVASWVSGYVGVGTASSVTTAIGGLTQFPTPSGGVQTTEVEYFRTSAGLGLFTQLRFPGQYLDPETDLIENWNRYYDASTGRYLAREPMLESPGHSKGMLSRGRQVPTYAYAEGNPLKYSDPNGLQGLDTFSSSGLTFAGGEVVKVGAAMAGAAGAGAAAGAASSSFPQEEPEQKTVPTVGQPEPLPPAPRKPDCQLLYTACLAACASSCENTASRGSCKASCFAAWLVCVIKPSPPSSH